MFGNGNLFQRPVLVVAALAFGGAAILVSNLAEAWDIALLRNALLLTLFGYLGIGAGCALVELSLRGEAEKRLIKAKENGQPADKNEARFARKLERWMAALCVVAFAKKSLSSQSAGLTLPRLKNFKSRKDSIAPKCLPTKPRACPFPNK